MSLRSVEGDVQLRPVTIELLRQVEVFRTAAIERLAVATSDEERWNARVALVAYELGAARGLRPVELVRFTASDVSLSRDVLLLRHPKATRRGADPRPVPLGPTLVTDLQPLIDGLRRTHQDDAPVLSVWRDGALQPASPKQISQLASAICGRGTGEPGHVGKCRHLNIQLLEALEHGFASGPSSYALQRGRSAAVGHGQSGGWSIYLGVDPQVVREIMERLDRYLQWKSAEDTRTLVPPFSQPATPRRRSTSTHTQGRSGSDWATLGLELSGVEVDLMSPAYERLWDFRWAELFGLQREEALATALFIQLVGFGEILAPVDAVPGLTWDDVELSDDGLLLSIALSNANGKLKVWVGAAELLLCRRLRAAGASGPFSRVRMDIVNPLLEWLFGRTVTLEELQRANRLAHLGTHPPDHIGYLTGKVSHKLLVEPDREMGGSVRHQSDPLFQPLESVLRQRSEKVTLHELEGLVDAALPAWRGWSVGDAGALVPKLIIESLRLCCGTPMRNGRRSRSPSTLRALLQELCLLRAVLADRPIHQLTKADVDLALDGRRAEARLNSAIHWLARACRKQELQPPRQFRLTEQRFFRPVELPRSVDVYAVIDSYEPPQRPLVALVLMCCCVARKSEIGRLRLGDLLMDDHVLLVDIRAAKGGRPAQRRVRIPRALRPLIAAMSQHIQRGERESRLLQPLVARSSSTDAIFQRLSYRLAGRSIKWTPHMMRAIASTEARRAGMDPAQIGATLGHKLVATTVQHYIAFDPLDVKPRAMALADALPGRLTTSAIAYVFGVSLRTAEGLRRTTGGDLRLLAGSHVRHRAA